MNELFLKKAGATVLIVLLAIFLFTLFKPFLTAALSSLIIATLFMPINKFLVKKGIKKSIAALIVIILVILIIIIPTTLITILVYKEILSVLEIVPEVLSGLSKISLLKEWITPSFEINLSSLFLKLVNFISDSLVSIITFTANFVLSLFVFLVLTFYMLKDYDKILEEIKKFIPFTKKNSEKIIEEFKKETRSAVFGMGLISLIQGLLLALGLYLVGIKTALFWGIVGAILAFLPFVGTSLVFIPAAAYLFYIGKITSAFVIFAWGLLISNIDIFLRPFLMEKISKIHPVIVILGVFMAVPYFGIIGIILGPLLLSYFFLFIKMYREEYINSQ